MEHRISATDLARKLGDVLGRVRYRGESFVIERNGAPVARLGPVPRKTAASLREALRAWRASGDADSPLADDLERIGASDRPPGYPWAS
jgi:prevent-host-death family protein